MEFLHDGRPPVVREAVYAPPPVEPLPLPTKPTGDYTDDAAEDPRLAQRRQQGMGHPPVRPRGARRQRRQAAGRRGQRRPERRRRAAARARQSRRGIVDRLRHEPALRRPRYLLDGRQRDRRGGAQLRGRRRRSARGSPSSTTSAGATPTGPKRSARWSARRWPATTWPSALGTPFISGKDSLNNEFRPARAPTEPISHPAVAADQRAGPGRRRRPLRDDGPEGAGQPALPGRHDEERTGRLALRPGRRSRRRRSAARSMPQLAKQTFAALHQAIDAGLVRACHDLSEGGLAVAAAEMAFAGGLGRDDRPGQRAACACRRDAARSTPVAACSANRTRGSSAKCRRTTAAAFEAALAGVPHARGSAK